MSKIMSMFEKFNLLEKVNNETTNENNVDNDININAKFEEVKNENKSENEEVMLMNNGVEEKAIESNLDFKKIMNISEIYSSYGIENSNIGTVFMLGNFINALPESLPYEVKKNSVMNIIEASNTDLNKLISDGSKRVSILNEFINNYEQTTIGTIEEYKDEIFKLAQLIEKYKEQISIKETMLEEQRHIIKYEWEKINKIIDFFEK
ncbi:hypothetical protein GCM10008905_18720 [Clostridium malenominatum]|uniref:Uncharacterized protein n=1 Tax=Clostridium malenominatum TaxID=1539 RepID=A0ABP3U8S3_9CLOT